MVHEQMHHYHENVQISVKMEPPDEPTKEICPGCQKPFKSVSKHIVRSKTCNGGSKEQQEAITKNAAIKRTNKRNLKRKLERASQDGRQKRALESKKYYESHKKEIQQKYQKNKKKIAENYKMVTKSLQNFFKEIQFGPVFPCISCMRCLPFRSVVKMTDKFYHKLLENHASDNLCREEHLKMHGNWYLCSTCYSHLSRGNMPSQCHKNGLKLANVPECLKISDVGNQLLAKNLVFIKVGTFNFHYMNLHNMITNFRYVNFPKQE